MTLPGRGHRVVAGCLEGMGPELPFHEADGFPWAARLASQAEHIRRELEEHKSAAEDWVAAPEGTWGTMDAPEWSALGLVQGSCWIAGDQFPKTRAVLASLPGMCPDEVMFARLPAGARIGPHSDNVNYVL